MCCAQLEFVDKDRRGRRLTALSAGRVMRTGRPRQAELKPDVLASSATLVLEGAELMAKRYLDEAELRADIPNQQADGGLPEMMLARKEGALDDWVYDGCVCACMRARAYLRACERSCA